MDELSQVSKRQPYRRSPLLIAAYCAIGAALMNLILGTGFFLMVGSAALAVVFGSAAIIVRLRRRKASA
jgi:hypothetical protein